MTSPAPDSRPNPSQESTKPSPTAPPGQETSRARATLARLVEAARAVADAEPSEIEDAARRLGRSRTYLAPVAWAAGALVLLVRGIRLLTLNPKLTLVELVPAVWIWVVMWDLKQNGLRTEAFRHLTGGGVLLLTALAVAASITAFWCNTVFAFAVGGPRPQIGPAVQQARPYLRTIAGVGLVMGLITAAGGVAIPRIESVWLYLVALGGLYS